MFLVGRDSRSLPALVTGNLDNLVYFSDHGVIRASVIYAGGGGAGMPLGLGEVSQRLLWLSKLPVTDAATPTRSLFH